MQKILFFICFVLLFCSSFAKEELFEKPIDIINRKEFTFEEFSKKYIDDIDIEKFIKKEIENDYIVVSLDECLDVAFKNNFNIQISNHSYLSSKYEYQNSLSKFLPILETTTYVADYSGTILVGGILRDRFHETVLSVNLTAQHDLTQGGKQIFESRAKNFEKSAKNHELKYTKSEIIYLTSRYYYEMLLAKIYIEIYLRNLIERKEQLNYAKNLKSSGFGTNFDVVRSESEVAQAKILLFENLNKFRMSQSRLANLMGIDVNCGLMPIEDEIKPLNVIIEDVLIDDYFKIALENREDLKTIKDYVKVEKQIKNIYFTDFMPKPLISYQQQFQGIFGEQTYPNYILTGFMNWNLGENSGIGTLTKIKAQNEKIKKIKLEYENKLRNIQQAIIDLNSTYFFSKKQMKIASDRVNFSNEGVRLAILRFNYGKGIILDVIEAQSEATKAKVEYAKNIANYNIAQLELLFNVGLINKDDIVDKYLTKK